MDACTDTYKVEVCNILRNRNPSLIGRLAKQEKKNTVQYEMYINNMTVFFVRLFVFSNTGKKHWKTFQLNDAISLSLSLSLSLSPLGLGWRWE